MKAQKYSSFVAAFVTHERRKYSYHTYNSPYFVQAIRRGQPKYWAYRILTSIPKENVVLRISSFQNKVPKDDLYILTMRNSRRTSRLCRFTEHESDSESDGLSSSEVESIHESDRDFVTSDEEDETWSHIDYQDLEGDSESDTESQSESVPLPQDELEDLSADEIPSLDFNENLDHENGKRKSEQQDREASASGSKNAEILAKESTGRPRRGSTTSK
jgi:hypothetical protein